MALRISKIPLLRQLYFYLLLAVIVTTVISWYNANSLCIIATLLLVLIDGNPFTKIRRAFNNVYFVSYFSFFILLATSLSWSDNLETGWKHVESKFTLLAVPFLMYAGPLQGKDDYKKLMSAWCIILLVTTIICLSYAVYRYMDSQDISMFFYHSLVELIEQNAIVYSIYLLLGLLFLLSSPLYAKMGSDRVLRYMRYFLIFFFTGIIILLSSKLMLVLLGIILFTYILIFFTAKKNRWVLAGICTLFFLVVALLIITDNPIKKRYTESMVENLEIVNRSKYTTTTEWNGVTLRLVIWRYANELLNKHNAWVTGLGIGDAQDLLDQKYRDMDMYIGEKGGSRGFLGYNFHNQYIEEIAHGGMIGLFMLVWIFFLQLKAARRSGRTDAWFSVIIVIAVCLTESLLELQHGLFLFTFYPFALLKYTGE